MAVGDIIQFQGVTPRANSLDADGSNVSRTTYADLFAVVGTTYGVGDGSTTFGLPTVANHVILYAENTPSGSSKRMDQLPEASSLVDTDIVLVESAPDTLGRANKKMSWYNFRTAVTSGDVTIGGDLILTGVTEGLSYVDAGGQLRGLTLDAGLNYSAGVLSLDTEILSQLERQGTWDAATNTPAIPAASSSNNGWFYIVQNSVAVGHGYANVPNVAFKAGDWILSNGSTWERIKNSAATNWIQNGADVEYSGGDVVLTGGVFIDDNGNSTEWGEAYDWVNTNSSNVAFKSINNNFPATNFTGIITSTGATINGASTFNGKFIAKTLNNVASMSTLANGDVEFGSATATVGLASPVLQGKTTDTDRPGLFIVAGSNNSNALTDMQFDVREHDNTDFSTLTSKAFRWTRFGNELMYLTRGGNFATLGSLTSRGITVQSSAGTMPWRILASSVSDELAFYSNTQAANVLVLDDVGDGIFSNDVYATTFVTSTGDSGEWDAAATWVDANSANVVLISSSGTSNYLPKFSGSNTLENSSIQDSGGFVTIFSETTVGSNLNVTGNITTSSYGTSTNWKAGYDYSLVGHLPLTGGTLTGSLTSRGLTVQSSAGTLPWQLVASSISDELAFYSDTQAENILVLDDVGDATFAYDVYAQTFYAGGYDSGDWNSTAAQVASTAGSWNSAYTFSSTYNIANYYTSLDNRYARTDTDATMTDSLTIGSSTIAKLILNDTGAIDTTDLYAYMQFNYAGSQGGLLGYLSDADDVFSIKNNDGSIEISTNGGNIRMETFGAGAFIVPSLTSTEESALSKVNGMIIYNETTNKLRGCASGSFVDLH